MFFVMPDKEIQWFFYVPGSLKNVHSSPAVIYYVLYSNFFYTQLASAFVPQKDF